MRELKFIAYDVKSGKLSEPFFVGWKQADFGDFKIDVCNCQCNVMQYTGKLDKNNNEIYDGHILKIPVKNHQHIYGEYEYRVVKWKNGSFAWILDGAYAWMSFSGAFGEDGNLMDYSSEPATDTVEIVGHIMTTPELLQEQ